MSWRRVAMTGLVLLGVSLVLVPAAGAVTFSDAPGSPIAVGHEPFGIVAGDFNGDGRSDLAVANAGDGTVSVLLGDGHGGFTNAPGSPISVPSAPDALAVGDFNGDGKLDLAVISDGTNPADVSFVTVLLGDGHGGFTPAPGSPISVPLGAGAIAVGDFNGDGIPDLAVTAVDDSGGNIDMIGKVSVLLGNGDGSFHAAPGSPINVGIGPEAIAVGDFNGDSHQDLAVANAGSGTLSVLLGNGDGSFNAAPGSPIDLGATLPRGLSTADLNGDGKADLVIANGDAVGDPAVGTSVLLGTGDGRFVAAPGSPFAGGEVAFSDTLGDFGNGNLDVVLPQPDLNAVSVLVGDGSGGFGGAGSSRFAVGSGPRFAVVGDFNGDGRNDLAVTNTFDNTVSIMLNAPPAAEISGGPQTSTYATGASFRLHSNDSSSTFQCKLDDGGFEPCTSPVSYSGLAAGSHTLSVTATNDVNLTSAVATRTWSVTPPDTLITSGPSGNTRSTNASFRFSSDASPVTFQCALDGGGWSTCGSSASYGDLSAGSHTLAVRAVNAGGSPDPVGASRTWTVDLTSPPVAALSASPNPALAGTPVTLDASASHDPLDGTITDYQWDLGSGAFTEDTGSTSTNAWTPTTSGTAYVRVRVTNEVGTTAIATVDVDVRPAPPAGPVGVSINDGDYATDSPNVVLYVVWPPLASEALISNDGGFGPAGDTTTTPLAATIPWTLRSGASAPVDTSVYLRFPDSANPTNTFSDDIVLDTTAPDVESATLMHRIVSNPTRARTFRVRLRATDHLSGIRALQFSTAKTGGTTVTLAGRGRRGVLQLTRTISVRMTKAPRYVRAQSVAGAWSKWQRIT